MSEEYLYDKFLKLQETHKYTEESLRHHQTKITQLEKIIEEQKSVNNDLRKIINRMHLHAVNLEKWY